jgi:hypothetical protein
MANPQGEMRDRILVPKIDRRCQFPNRNWGIKHEITMTKPTQIRSLFFLLLAVAFSQCLSAQDIRVEQTREAGGFTFFLSENAFPDGASVLWDLGDGQVSESPRARHRYRFSGQYEVRAFVWTSNGRARRYVLQVEYDVLSGSLAMDSRPLKY